MISFTPEVRLPPNLTRTSPIVEGDDLAPWFRSELPHWTVEATIMAAIPADDPMVVDRIVYVATSPTHDLDGISIEALDPVELVERVRAFDRLLALAAGVQGMLPVGRPLGGCWVDADPQNRDPSATLDRVQAVVASVTRHETIAHPQGIVPEDPPVAPPQPPRSKTRVVSTFDPTALGPEEPSGTPDARTIAQAMNYSGDPCTTCGSLRTRRNGSCLVCDDCGSNNGCS
jgi:hypothetical protein